jgi:serine-type D-Ala-D-Ala endopeptidase (penicillin-binding protein 7)
MKRWIVGILVCALMLLGPTVEAGAKRHAKQAGKPHAVKVAKSKKVGKGKLAKSGKVKAAKKAQSGKSKKSLAKRASSKVAAKGKAGKRAFAKSKKQRQMARARATHHARHAGASSRLVSYAPRAEADEKPRVMRLDYGDALSGAELELRSAAVLVVDQKTGEALYSKNPDTAAPIASITKLMTALVTLDAGLSMDDEITIGMQDVDRLKGTGSRLPLGATLTRGELMHLALIASENRAAAALSRAYPGGREAFIAAMNRKAASLGMHNTYYVDGTGLSSDNRSTAADLARLVDTASRYPMIRQISSTGSYGVTVPGQRIARVKERGKWRRVSMPTRRSLAYYNTNALTRNTAWDIGVSKTGYINEAGHCLVMQTRIAERKVIIVLLDSWGKMSRIGDANRIRQWLENSASGHFASRAAPPA